MLKWNNRPKKFHFNITLITPYSINPGKQFQIKIIVAKSD